MGFPCKCQGLSVAFAPSQILQQFSGQFPLCAYVRGDWQRARYPQMSPGTGKSYAQALWSEKYFVARDGIGLTATPGAGRNAGLPPFFLASARLSLFLCFGMMPH
ncbi:hypothetical protein [Hahella sp. HN01]|uniref:hypothetical protein n=1 Tax=unclassified Hahella TaxID=2624107 RepID=UPI001C1ECBCC|nr:hypothetical protein [Hahella sp. HN01]MBU6951057.1 hypothetical protein [Hahella sp. HN01]